MGKDQSFIECPGPQQIDPLAVSFARQDEGSRYRRAEVAQVDRREEVRQFQRVGKKFLKVDARPPEKVNLAVEVQERRFAFVVHGRVRH